MNEASHQFLKDLDKSRAERDGLPKAAQRVDAEASGNHAVLGLIFLKYVSDSFAMRQREIEAPLRGRQGNANFAWIQHMLHHLAPNGSGTLEPIFN